MADIKIAEKAAREIEQTVFAGLIHRINREKSIAAMAKIVERAIAESQSSQPDRAARRGAFQEVDLRSAAAEMNLDAATLLRIEQGRMPSAETLVKIMEWLWKGNENV
jgi:transcriptional regulator with XRE-family HTH domain